MILKILLYKNLLPKKMSQNSSKLRTIYILKFKHTIAPQKLMKETKFYHTIGGANLGVSQNSGEAVPPTNSTEFQHGVCRPGDVQMKHL